MGKVKFLEYIGGDRWADSPVDPEPSLERQIVRERRVFTERLLAYNPSVGVHG